MRNIVNIEEVINKRDFFVWFIMNGFPEGLDKDKDMSIYDVIEENYSFDMDWFNKFTNYYDGIFEENDGYVDNPNAIIISYSDEDLIYMQYTAVVELLEKQGFKNITIYETKLDVDYHEVGEVESISIDTDSNFNKGDYFLPDDLIIIYYYSNMDE
jgi:hypothetical protein